MWKDTIIEELHKLREEHAKKFNYDLKAILDDLKTQEKNSTRKIISSPFKARGVVQCE